MPDVLFLCTGNSCRSQMAEGWLRHLGGGRFAAFSAGLRPGVVHQLAIEVMREVGVDISQQVSKDVSTLLGRHFAYVITVCDRARDSCPIFPGPSMREHWPIEDPATVEARTRSGCGCFARLGMRLRNGCGNGFAQVE